MPGSGLGGDEDRLHGAPPKCAEGLQRVNCVADVNAFFPGVTTIHVGDSVRFAPAVSDTFDFPARGGEPLPLFCADGSEGLGLADAAAARSGSTDRPAGVQPGARTARPVRQERQYNGSNAGRERAAARRTTPAGDDPFTKPGPSRTLRRASRHEGHWSSSSRRAARCPSAGTPARWRAPVHAAPRRVAAGAREPSAASGTVTSGIRRRRGRGVLRLPPGDLTVSDRHDAECSDEHAARSTSTPRPRARATRRRSRTRSSASWRHRSRRRSSIRPRVPERPADADAPSRRRRTATGSGTRACWTRRQRRRCRRRAVTFTAPGKYEFYCLIHPFMHGTVVVR